MNIPRRRAAATPRLRRGYSAETSRGDGDIRSRPSARLRYDDAKTDAERTAKFLARHDGVGGDSFQERTPERVKAEIEAEAARKAARVRKARGGR